jgi:hypothetical protein
LFERVSLFIPDEGEHAWGGVPAGDVVVDLDVLEYLPAQALREGWCSCARARSDAESGLKASEPPEQEALG